jgi:hypothetical protein
VSLSLSPAAGSAAGKRPVTAQNPIDRAMLASTNRLT